MTEAKRKLIEVSLPLETINAESAREKSIRHGHPSTVHLWWARRPLAAARAVLFAQLVDDPSSRPDRFPTEEAQRKERERLHRLIERLVVWENARDKALLAEAREEIRRATGGHLPAVFDPFAGGGTIPLEAQRLGLEAHASDLNPVAVLLNKALVEIPSKFAGREPVFPGMAAARIASWEDATGLAADVRAYGEWMREEVSKRLGHLYPRAALPDGSQATVIAWLWARAVACPNPACGVEMPLVRSWWLNKKKGREAWVRPVIAGDPGHPSGKRVQFEIGHGMAGAPTAQTDGTVGRNGATCVACGAAVALRYVREEGREGRLGALLMAVVADGGRRRVYQPPDEEHQRAGALEPPDDLPDGNLPEEALGFRVQNYGLTRWADLFTGRQLVMLAAFNALVEEARERVLRDALAAGGPAGDRLADGGTGAAAYADAVATYLGLCASKMTVFHCCLARWRPDADKTAPAFGRPAMAMVWDFAETMPFAGAGGDWLGVVEGAAKALEGLQPTARGTASQQAAQDVEFSSDKALSTDPPYYDNIGYSDLSDFFYVWLRKSLRDVHPDLLSTMLVPKSEELVANPHRHQGEAGARQFFEDGFRKVFENARGSASDDRLMTVYYAFKQSDSDADGTASTGWETLLDGMINSGWTITATWPMRTEGATRMRNLSSNALASSIVLALRPRPVDAPTTDRRGLIAALHEELPKALRNLQQGTIAPVDLPQAAIGPGMAVFSRYGKVIENDGSSMTVRSALARINEILDEVLNEQEGDFDAATRFAIAWYRGQGYTTGTFGVADDLARARNTAVETMAREGILRSAAGKVTLFSPADLSEDYDVRADAHVGAWEVLHHLIAQLDRVGVPGAGAFMASVLSLPEGAIDVELVKELAFLLFSIAEKNGWTQDAVAFNTVATAWPEIVEAARARDGAGPQSEFDFEET